MYTQCIVLFCFSLYLPEPNHCEDKLSIRDSGGSQLVCFRWSQGQKEKKNNAECKLLDVANQITIHSYRYKIINIYYIIFKKKYIYMHLGDLCILTFTTFKTYISQVHSQ